MLQHTRYSVNWSGGSLSCSCRHPALEWLVSRPAAQFSWTLPPASGPGFPLLLPRVWPPGSWIPLSSSFDSLHHFGAARPPVASRARVMGENVFRQYVSKNVIDCPLTDMIILDGQWDFHLQLVGFSFRILKALLHFLLVSSVAMNFFLALCMKPILFFLEPCGIFSLRPVLWNLVRGVLFWPFGSPFHSGNPCPLVLGNVLDLLSPLHS